MRRHAERFAVPAALAALLAFGAFEVPSLCGTTAWTVALFDAHAGFADAGDSLRLALPAAAQAVGLVPLLVWLRRASGPRPRDGRRVPPSPAVVTAAGVTLAAAMALTVAVPAGVLAWRAGAAGWVGRVLDRLAAAGLRGGTGGRVGVRDSPRRDWRRGRWPRRGGRRGRREPSSPPVLLLPGLCGSLTLAVAAQAGLTAAAGAGLPGAAAVRETAAPYVLVLALALLPKAAVLAACAPGRTPARHLARSLRAGTARQRAAGRAVRWRLVGAGRLVRWGLLAVWGSAEVAAAAILLPPGADAAAPGLYNLMHYGHTGTLAAFCLIAAVVPAGLFTLAAAPFARRV